MGATVCPKFEKAMQFIGKQWTGLIVHQLLSGPKRFCEIEHALPISGRLLSERLKELEKMVWFCGKFIPKPPFVWSIR